VRNTSTSSPRSHLSSFLPSLLSFMINGSARGDVCAKGNSPYFNWPVVKCFVWNSMTYTATSIDQKPTVSFQSLSLGQQIFPHTHTHSHTYIHTICPTINGKENEPTQMQR
jgi:hypothetical protein